MATNRACARPRGREGSRGFTLVELMVVLVILVVGLLPLVVIQLRSRQNVADSGRFTEALALAQLQMESVKSRGFGNAQPDSGVVDAYAWRADVQPEGQWLERVTVQVTWNEHGRNRNVQVVNMMSLR